MGNARDMSVLKILHDEGDPGQQQLHLSLQDHYYEPLEPRAGADLESSRDVLFSSVDRPPRTSEEGDCLFNSILYLMNPRYRKLSDAGKLEWVAELRESIGVKGLELVVEDVVLAKEAQRCLTKEYDKQLQSLLEVAERGRWDKIEIS